jgi:cellulose synthase (UDP-forming)
MQSSKTRSLLALTLYAVVALAYVVWRATMTLAPHERAISLALLCVEASAILASIAQMTLFRPRRQRLAAFAAAPSNASVAVVIPVHREPLYIVLPTIAAALRIDYPHDTWVLDDGRDPALARACEALGVHYLTREDRRDYKAGNLNHFLARTDYQFMLCLDADGIAHPAILSQLLGYFADDRVGFVQPPIEIYGAPSFEHDPSVVVAGETWYENIILHKVMQPALGAHGAALWTGSGGVMRVAALRSIDGVATESFNDDVTTSYKLFARSWTSVYHPVALVKALCPQSARDYLGQRNRWTRGGAQMHRIFHPFTARKLDRIKRLALFVSFDYWLLQPWRLLVFAMVPAIAAFSGATPIATHPGLFVAAFLAVIVARQASIAINFGGLAGGSLNLVLALVALQHRLAGTWTFVTSSRSHFVTTGKGASAAGPPRRSRDVPLLLWFVVAVNAAACLKLVSLSWGVRASAWQLGWIAVGLGLAAFYVGFAVKAVRRIRQFQRSPERRAGWRCELQAAATLDATRVVVEDISMSGARLRSERGARGSGPMSLRLALGESIVTLRGVVARAELGTLCLRWEPGQERELAKLSTAYCTRMWS